MSYCLPSCPYCRREIPPACPACQGHRVKFNGRRGGRRRCRCLDCGQKFTAGARGRISAATWRIADELLRSEVEIKVIAKALDISRRHLYNRKAVELAG
jgi:transposase-like protein